MDHVGGPVGHPRESGSVNRIFLCRLLLQLQLLPMSHICSTINNLGDNFLKVIRHFNQSSIIGLIINF